MDRLLPLFPLRLVVFPGTRLPLHIFEDRYREMVGESIGSGTEFGIVLALEEGISETGCTVVVDSVEKKYDDESFDIVVRGIRRFEILSLNRDKNYLRADVAFLVDDHARIPATELLRDAISIFNTLQSGRDAPNPEDPGLSFRLADAIDDLNIRSVIQRAVSEAERLRLFTQLAGNYLERKNYRERMQKLAPTNGLGHKAAG